MKFINIKKSELKKLNQKAASLFPMSGLCLGHNSALVREFLRTGHGPASLAWALRTELKVEKE